MTGTKMVLTPRGLRCAGRVLPCSVGRGGLAHAKREGDGATPRGVHRIVAALYRADRMPRPISWATPIGPGDFWSDDPRDGHYNHMVRAPHGFGHELLRRGDRLYDLVLITDWNWPNAVPGRGSAIFVHRWRKPRHPTEGCIGLSWRDLLWLARRVSPGSRIIVP